MKYDLKKLRKSLGITAPEIAAEFGITEQTVYYWERQKAYPQYVKEWFEDKQAEKKGFESGANMSSINKRLRRLEKKVLTGGEDENT